MLFWPALLGLILFVYQMYRYVNTGNILESIDTPYNGLFGLFLSIWATIFVDGWRSKQDRMNFEWDMKALEDVLANDERKGKYHYMSEYNSETNTKVRAEIGAGRRQFCRGCNHLFNLFMIAIVIIVMLAFESASFAEIELITSDLIESPVITSFFDPIFVGYALVMEILGVIFEFTTIAFINQRNYRFKQEYNNAVALSLFTFNCINYFLPLAYIAFRKKNFQQLFTLLFVILVFEQIKANIYKFMRPYLCYRGKINKIKEEWRIK